jgi:nicotinamide-nucleotide amidase
MSIEVLAVGDELLSGATIDTNSNWIARELFTLGLKPARVTQVGDAAADLGDAFAGAWSRCRVLIVTGGLGPTVDDRTKEVIAAYFGDPLELDAAVLADLQARFARRERPMPPTNVKQALLPRGGTKVPNPVGSAPGVHWARDGREVFLLPGVPLEMQAMLQQTVLPRLRELYPASDLRLATFRTIGLPESELAERLLPLLEAYPDVEWAFYAGSGGVDVKLRRTGGDAAAWEELGGAVGRALGHSIYTEIPEEPLAEVVRQLLVERGWTLAVAESCTGGLVSARLTEVSGASACFTGGFVTYANAAKTAWVGVPEALLLLHGAVSAPVAAAMALGARERAGADLAVAVTGIAGPTGGTPEKPVGLVYFGLAAATGCWTRRVMLLQHREYNRRIASQFALDLVRRHLQGLPVGEPA